MTPSYRKYLVVEKWRTITAAAEALETSRSSLSYCISGKRVSPRLREKLAKALGKTVEEMFGDSSSDTNSKKDSAK